MAKKRGVGMSRTFRSALDRAYRSIIAAKAHASGQKWSILHRVESELARAMQRRSKISHPKTATRKSSR